MQNNLENSGLSTGNRWWMGIFGALEIFFGMIAIISPFAVSLSFMWIIGIVLMVLGLIRLFQAFSIKGNKLWNITTAIIYGIFGYFLYTDPGASIEITTLIIGWSLAIIGVFQCGSWLYTRSLPGSGWRLFSALITVILGVMVLIQWPVSSTWLIGTLIGVELMIAGWTLLIFSLSKGDSSSNE